MSSSIMSIEDKRVRKNEMARLKRANAKNSVVEIEEVKASPEPSQEPRQNQNQRLQLPRI